MPLASKGPITYQSVRKPKCSAMLTGCPFLEPSGQVLGLRHVPAGREGETIVGQRLFLAAEDPSPAHRLASSACRRLRSETRDRPASLAVSLALVPGRSRSTDVQRQPPRSTLLFGVLTKASRLSTSMLSCRLPSLRYRRCDRRQSAASWRRRCRLVSMAARMSSKTAGPWPPPGPRPARAETSDHLRHVGDGFHQVGIVGGRDCR